MYSRKYHGTIWNGLYFKLFGLNFQIFLYICMIYDLLRVKNQKKKKKKNAISNTIRVKILQYILPGAHRILWTGKQYSTNTMGKIQTWHPVLLCIILTRNKDVQNESSFYCAVSQKRG